MTIKKIKYIFLVLVMLCTGSAEEGMWLLNQLHTLDLESKGLEISVDEIYNTDQPSISDAIVWLGGCSSSFISPDGLLITNHHCAYSAVMRASTPENNYLHDGFTALNRSEEIEAPGARAYILLETRDVTAEILAAAKGIKDIVKRDRAIDIKMEAIKLEIEAGRDDYSTRIRAMYNGLSYFLYIYQRFDDVRLVVVPPSSIGKYGGDIDNWMWPRHTGDFAVYRVYSAPDGSGADFSPENVPYNPKSWLKISAGDLNEGDFTFILGFPGKTYRYRTSSSVDYNLHYLYPTSIKKLKEMIDLISVTVAESPNGKLKAESTLASLNNVMKKYQGLVDGMNRTDFLESKIDQEKEFMEFVNSKRKYRNKYGHILGEIENLYHNKSINSEQNAIFDRFRWVYSGVLISTSKKIYEIARELEKSPAERQTGYAEADNKDAYKRFKYSYYSYFEPTDRSLFKLTLLKAKDLAGDQTIRALDQIINYPDRTIDEYLDHLYGETRMNDPKFAKSLEGKTVQELMDLNDPFINLQAAIYDEFETKRLADKKFDSETGDLLKLYIEAMIDWQNENIYPDANSTLRFTYGYVNGYSPRDAINYAPFTTFNGMIDKYSGEDPFDFPEKLNRLHQTNDLGRWVDPDLDDVPACFLHECDITGGNSGSAVLNSRGELIGLAFDGNYEAMTGDWEYDIEIQRTISVDIRYVMFLVEKYAGAGYLLDEMEITD